MALPNIIVREADIPSPSPVVYRLFEMMFDPDTSLDDLARTLSSDAGLSARTLRAANAAYSSPEQRIEDVLDAVVRIGLVSTIHLITTAEIKAVFFAVPGHQGDMKRLWTHNLVTACLADAYARHLRLDRPARWYTGGLLHDIGRLVLLRHDPVKYADAMALVDADGRDICDAERELFRVSHEDVGAKLMQLWRFPDSIADAAYHHNRPFEAWDDFRSGISIANDLANALESNESLPHLEGLPVERIVAEASEKYETMKRASGMI